MGYTHYWYRRKTYDTETFKRVVDDFKKILPVMAKEYGLKLAGPDGTGEPVINEDEISFNGARNCGHPKRYELVIPWPSEDAGGVMVDGCDIKGCWFAGVIVETRICNGDCSYESFLFERDRKICFEWEEPRKGDLWFDFCKTGFRPYDLAVTAVLLIAKHYFGNDIEVYSDGKEVHWFDAKLLCQLHLGYGMEYGFDPDTGQLVAIPEIQRQKKK